VWHNADSYSTHSKENAMIKMLHLLFVLLTLAAFGGKMFISVARPELLSHKAVKIAPHVISTLLLLTGIILVFQGNWLAGDYGWLVAKIIALFGFIGLGIMAMRSEGTNRWLAFGGAIVCFIYIGIVAVSKNAFFFL
jgi:uncharacterized membrane protein SirB2